MRHFNLSGNDHSIDEPLSARQDSKETPSGPSEFNTGANQLSGQGETPKKDKKQPAHKPN